MFSFLFLMAKTDFFDQRGANGPLNTPLIATMYTTWRNMNTDHSFTQDVQFNGITMHVCISPNREHLLLDPIPVLSNCPFEYLLPLLGRLGIRIITDTTVRGK